MEHYPNPKVPIHPILNASAFSLQNKPVRKSLCILDNPQAKLVTSGRVAIALAIQHSGVGKGDKVLIPAYHCSSMVEPVIWVDAEPVFYQINSNTSINIDDIKQKTDNKVKFIIVTHYFGFMQELNEIRQWCDEKSIILLEDCAHAFFGQQNGLPIGAIGDYSIASIMKFFPVYDGGCLTSRKHDIQNIKLKSPGKAFQIKASLNLLENAFTYNRLPFFKLFILPPLYLKDFLWNTLKFMRKNKPTKIGPAAAEGGYAFEASWIDKRISSISRIILNQSNNTKIIEIRRNNYLTYFSALSNIKSIKPLHSQLPEKTVPYVFPLLVENPQVLFPILKKKGIPIIRFGEFLWDNVNESVCKNSIELSKKVFQFPCHQSLKPDELNWIIETILKEVQTILEK